MKHKIIYENLGCKLLQPHQHHDSRGFFCELLNDSLENFLNFKPVQENSSFSHKNVIRGLHIQYKPHTSKLIRVTSGRILDVAVDCRPFSKTFGNHVMVELSSETTNMFYIPEGFAHGFLSLEDKTVVNYYVNQIYNPSGELSINAFSKSLSIDWKLNPCDESVIMSEKDKLAIDFEKVLWKQFY